MIESADRTIIHQSWPINGGALLFQIRTNRALVDGEYTELGKMIGELERFVGMLSWVDPTDPVPASPHGR